MTRKKNLTDFEYIQELERIVRESKRFKTEVFDIMGNMAFYWEKWDKIEQREFKREQEKAEESKKKKSKTEQGY